MSILLGVFKLESCTVGSGHFTDRRELTVHIHHTHGRKDAGENNNLIMAGIYYKLGEQLQIVTN